MGKKKILQPSSQKCRYFLANFCWCHKFDLNYSVTGRLLKKILNAKCVRLPEERVSGTIGRSPSTYAGKCKIVATLKPRRP